MYRNILLLALTGLALTCCKPTERTASKVPAPKTEEQGDAAESAVGTPIATFLRGADEAEQVMVEPAPASEPAPAPAASAPAAAVDLASSLLSIALTVQDYNRVMPWEKKQASGTRLNGVYLGDGRVLTLGSSMALANYVEISLPDSSKTVPARVLRYDADLNLALLTVVNEEDAAIFETRTPLALGPALERTGRADLLCTHNGTQSAAIPLEGEVGTAEKGLPRLQMRAEQAVPGNYSHGAPIVADGKLVGLSAGYNAASRQLKVINGELLARFLNADENAPTGVPQMGVSMAELTDPVFRRYLKLSDAQTGVYLCEVEPMGAAAAAGLQKGDVLTSVEGMPVDNRGRCELPTYGLLDVSTVVRYLKPLGESVRLTYSRDGQEHETTMPLNRDAEEKALIRTEKADEAPRYLVWGGLVFQPLTNNYLEALKAEAKALPTEFMQLRDQEDELRKRGFRELTALTLVVPTKATLGYDTCTFCLVEKVNGQEPHTFEEFVSLLTSPTESGMVELSINKSPYRIYMESAAAEAANDELRRAGIIRLQRLTSQED
jgi:S1-C subfamily serine protease